MKHIKHLLLLLIFPLTLNAQKEMTLTLDECIKLANEQSLQAFLTRNMYLADYWDFRSYKASLLPSLHLNTTPISLNNGITQVWNSNINSYETKHTQSLSTSAEVQIKQSLKLTGGTISVESGNSYFDSNTGSSFISNPLSISYSQNLNGYNRLKWQSRIDPKKYEAAKAEYLEGRESISISSIQYFFKLISSQIDLEITKRNYANSKELYNIGKGRFEVGTITQDELLNLELSLYNSEISLTKSEQNLLRARIDLNIYLNIDKSTIIHCIIPDDIPNIEIPVNDAVDLAFSNNSFSKSQKVSLLQQQQSLSQTKANNRFTSNLQMSYGLNGDNQDITDSYSNLSERQRINLGFSIPIIDWGEGKGAIAVAKSKLEAEKIKLEQARIAFGQDVSVNVLEFNLQKAQVDIAAKADTIAQKGYEISYEIFKLGKLDVIKLNQARNDQELARKAYISSLQSYWRYWYNIRKLTLFDFEKNITLSEDFDALINE